MGPDSVNGQAMPPADPLYDTKTAAAYLAISASSLERFRLTGTPQIPFIKFPGRRGAVRYRKSALDTFLANSIRTSTSEYDQ